MRVPDGGGEGGEDLGRGGGGGGGGVLLNLKETSKPFPQENLNW